ncbi:hypothetical protein H4R19_005534 [Coemansia spiralis]|nr:hypothetical protein H4R19_005534 [Coemansia spiralis]
MTRRRQAITEKVPTTPRKVVVYSDNLMIPNSARNTTAQESDKELEHSLGDTLNTALVISTSYRFTPELNMLEILDPHNPRNYVEAKGITNYEVSIKLFILSAAVDANRRPSPLYVKQALTCIRRQLGAVIIEELFVSFSDVTAGRVSATAADMAASPAPAETTTNDSAAADANGSANGSAEVSANGSGARTTGSPSPTQQEPGPDPGRRYSRRAHGRSGTRGQKTHRRSRNGSVDAGNSRTSGNEGSSAEETDPNDMSRYLKIWRLLNRLKAEGDVTRIGICDVTKEQLENLCVRSRMVPDMVQIRADDGPFSADSDPAAGETATTTTTTSGGGDASGELRKLAMANNISVRSHSDSPEMLSNATFQALAADYRINERFPTTEVPPEGYRIDLMRPRWVANYNVALRNRGLIANRGYIVMASSDCVLDPNRVSMFG